MLVSVIMPVYNVEKYLAESLDSLIAQTMPDFEVITVDDGSTDGSNAILQAYAEKDKRFTLVTQPNSYAGVARNNGFKRAKGKYALFLDPDDTFEKDMLAEITSAAEKNEADVVAFSFWRENVSTGKRTGEPYGLTFRTHNKPFAAKDVSASLFQLCLNCPFNKLIRRDLIAEGNLEFQSTRNTNDVYFAAMALLHAKRIYCLKKRFVHYRYDNPHSLQGSRKKSLLDFTVAMKGVYDHLIADGVYETYKKTFMRLLLDSTTFVLGSVACVEDFAKAYDKIAELFAEPISKCSDGIFAPVNLRLARGLQKLSHEEYLLSCAADVQTGAIFRKNREYRLGSKLLSVPAKFKKLVDCYKNR